MIRVFEASVAFSSWFFRTVCLFCLLAAIAPVQEKASMLHGAGVGTVFVRAYRLEQSELEPNAEKSDLFQEVELHNSDSPGDSACTDHGPPDDQEITGGAQEGNINTNYIGDNTTIGAISIEDKDYETILENTERMVISITKRDTTRMNKEGKTLSQRRSYSEMVLKDSLRTERIRHKRHKQAQLENDFLEASEEFSNSLKPPLLDVDKSEGDTAKTMEVRLGQESSKNLPFSDTDKSEIRPEKEFMTIKENREKYKHGKHALKTFHSRSHEHKYLHADQNSPSLASNEKASMDLPTRTKSHKSSSPPPKHMIMRKSKSRPFSFKNHADAETLLRKMSFKGYHREVEVTEEPVSLHESGNMQSDDDISNDLSTFTEVEDASNHIEDPTQLISEVYSRYDIEEESELSSVYFHNVSATHSPSISSTTDTAITTTASAITTTTATSTTTPPKKRVYNYPKKPRKESSTVRPITYDEKDKKQHPSRVTTEKSYKTRTPFNEKKQKAVKVITSTTTEAPERHEKATVIDLPTNMTTTASPPGSGEEDNDLSDDELYPAFIPAKLPFGPFLPNQKGRAEEEEKTYHHHMSLVPNFKPTYIPYYDINEKKKPSNFIMNVLSPILGIGLKSTKSDENKELLKYDNERSHSEEMFNRVSGSYMPSFVTKDRSSTTLGYPYIPGVRQDKNRILVGDKLHGGFAYIDRNYERQESFNKKLQGTENSPRNQNLIILGHITDDSVMDDMRKCTSYVKVNLTDHYSMSDLISESTNPLRQLIIYMNLVSLNYEGYNMVVDRTKHLMDYLVMNHGGLTVFSVIPTDAEDINMTKSQEVKTQLVTFADDVLDYCAQNFPVCYGSIGLTDILENLKHTYNKDSGFDVYHAGGTGRNGACDYNEVCGTEVPPRAEDKKHAPTSLEQLKSLKDMVCQSSYHIMVELLVNLPTYDFEDYARAMVNAKTESLRVRAQTGLVLHDILPRDLKQYDKNRPPKYEGHATIVYFHVTVLSVDSINEESMTYVADIFLAQSWRDHRLRLPENMTEEYRILDVEWLHNIWRPDCFFKNAKRVTFHEMSVPNHYLWLYHDKTLLYMAKLTLVLSCAMKFEAYPHDTQICSMMIESLSHTTHDLVFKWNETDPLVVNPDIELPQLDISRNNTEDCTLTYSTGNFTCLAVVFNLRRRLGYHLFHTYVPSAITVVMSWISFWIKPEAIPARVTLGVTSLLTLATQNQQSQSSLPPVSYIKAIDVWMSSCTVFVFASLLQFGIVNYFMDDLPLTKDMTGYSVDDLTDLDEKKSEDGRLNGYSRSRSRSRSVMRSRSPGVPQYVVHRCTGKDIAVYIDKFSRFFFPFAFFVLNVSYWTTYGTM